MKSERTFNLVTYGIECGVCGGDGRSFMGTFMGRCLECNGTGFEACVVCGKRDASVAVRSTEGPACVGCMDEER